MVNGEQSDDLGVRKRVSIVWKYFEKLSKFRVRCNLCQHEQNYQSTTGNILRHLKSKHNIDATIKGQKENPEGILIPKLETEQIRKESRLNDDEEVDVNEDSSFEDNENVVATQRQERGQRGAKTKVVSYCEDGEEDPYAEESIQYEEYMVTADPAAEQCKDAPQGSSKKRKSSLEEKRILAETEYFREKAAYYRMQKNLAALQAKKVKYELDQLNR